MLQINELEEKGKTICVDGQIDENYNRTITDWRIPIEDNINSERLEVIYKRWLKCATVIVGATTSFLGSFFKLSKKKLLIYEKKKAYKLEHIYCNKIIKGEYRKACKRGEKL